MTQWLFIIALLVLIVWWNARLSTRRVRAWRAAAAACELAHVKQRDLWGSPRLDAEASGRRVRFEEYSVSRSICATRIVVESPACRADAMRIVRQGLDTDIKRVFGFREIEVGDRDFDARFVVGGISVFLLALLDAETRRRLMAIDVEAQVFSRDGELVAQFPWRETPRAVTQLLGVALHIGGRVGAESDVVRRLADNALEDPLPSVRLRNLLALTREFGDQPTTRDTLRAAATDVSPEVRLEAARALGGNTGSRELT